ncbi:MAG: N-6 DNA methylase, partial [Micrococcaceae bacterium]
MSQNKLVEVDNASVQLAKQKSFNEAEMLVKKLVALLGGEYEEVYKPLEVGITDSVENYNKIYQKNSSGSPYRREVYQDNKTTIELFHLRNKRSKQDIQTSMSSLTKWVPGDDEDNGEQVGISFFITVDNSVIMAMQDELHNIRLVEIGGGLSNTQKTIFSEIENVIAKDTRQEIFETIWHALRLQTVNNDFYKGIVAFFADLVDHLGIDNKDVEANKLFASKLLGRLLFLWFVREEKVIPEFDEDATADSDKYYKEVLKPLFDKLSTPTRYGDDKTPYLNGGLFSGDSVSNLKVSFPPEFFTDLFGHFKGYNFTTDESSPDFEQVAIDPEMLGKVFESLLGALVTETGKDVRKSKGTFYTPREIVEYMCKESLKQHFYGKYDSEKVKTYINQIIDFNDAEWDKKKSVKPRELKLIDDLKQLKILDPACGSGAFPMGMQQLLLKIYKRHDGSSFDAYQRKLSIIENNIYGSDIEPMAIEIAKLRAWLSLVVEYEGNAEILPLPNLEFKYVCANSLIPLKEVQSESDDYQDLTFEGELNDIRERFFNARSPEKKKEIIAQFRKYTSHSSLLETEGSRNQQLSTYNPFERGEVASFFDSRVMFGVDAFDIVIGNPPYVHLEKIKDTAQKLYKPLGYSTYEARGDIYSLFYEFGSQQLKDKGILSFITSNKWLRAGYGSSLRDYFISNVNPLLLIDLGGGVFDSATVDTNILILRKESYSGITKSVAASKDFSIENMSDYIRQNTVDMNFKPGES